MLAVDNEVLHHLELIKGFDVLRMLFKDKTMVNIAVAGISRCKRCKTVILKYERLFHALLV